MQTNFLGRPLTLFACMAMLALIGCGGGSSPSGSGETTYTLGGTLAGLGAAQSVRLEDNGGDTLTLSANGPFSFPMSLDTGSTYAITVQSHTPGIACTVSNGSGTVSSANVTGLDVSCASGTETILYSFGASATDGQNPAAGLIVDSTGNLYGTTVNGGSNNNEITGDGDGTVFKISPAAAGMYTETILYSFGASDTDGMWPYAGLIMDSAGNLYGTTNVGGANDHGTVFKIGDAGTETILHPFGASATDGQNPEAGLIMDSAGNLYGTTAIGGANGCGTVFEIGAAGAETILHSFGASVNDGQLTDAGLIMDSDGNLYGTTEGSANGNGTVFKIGVAGAETILYSFGASAAAGLYPEAGLIMDSDGNLYGTTRDGGTNGNGTVFKIGASGAETILYSFGASATDGQYPMAGLVMDSDGNLYGTTIDGGANGNGTVFKISASGTETILYSFGASTSDGQYPWAGLIMDSAGNLYGTTVDGGANGVGAGGDGTVFVID